MLLYRHRDPRIESSLRHSVRDGVAYSVMTGAGETYLSAFALFLRASTQEIALLAALPPLIGSWMQLISAWLSAGRARWRKPMIVGGAFVQGLVWLPLMILPLWFPQWSVALLISCVVLYHIASHSVSPQWGCLMGELVPEGRRGRYFGHRSRLATMTSFIALLAAGGVLHVATGSDMTLQGYLLIFAVAMLARFVSVYHLGRMYDPREDAPEQRSRLTLRDWMNELKGTPFLRFASFVAAMQGAVAISGPFFTVHMLRNLEFSYLQFTAITATSVVMQFLTLAAWGRIADAFGNRLILVVTGSIIPFLPALWLFSENFWYFLGLQCLAGMAWGGFTLSCGNYLYELLPGKRMAPYMAVNAVLTALGVFTGSMLGGALAYVWPESTTLFGFTIHWTYALFGVFLVSSLMRLAVAAVALPRLKELRRVRPLTARGLFFRATRLYPSSGFIFDPIATFRREKRLP